MTTNLNPHAPEYKPIKPGISPYPHAAFPFFLSPPPPSTAHRPPPSFRPPCLLPYQPSASRNTQPQLYPTTYSTYYVTPQNHVPTNPPAAARRGLSERGSTARGRGSRLGQKTRVGFRKHERGVRNEETRHRIVPLKRGEDQTTVMIKNIPYDCPRKVLIGMLDNFCLMENQAINEGTSTKEADEPPITCAFDFLYLPIDFRTKKSRGFAFVNFTNSRAVWRFFDCFHLKKWDFVEGLKWPKKMEVVSAKIQGKEALVKHFSESIFECESDEYLPLGFSPARDGSGQAVELTVVGVRRPAARWKPRYNHKA